MNEIVIITSYYVIDEVLKALGHQDHKLAQMTDAQVLTIAVLAALYFQKHHERALWVLCSRGYFQQRLSSSRFHRRLHQLAPWLPGLLAILGGVFRTGEV